MWEGHPWPDAYRAYALPLLLLPLLSSLPLLPLSALSYALPDDVEVSIGLVRRPGFIAGLAAAIL